jgi:hypothetical protein
MAPQERGRALIQATPEMLVPAVLCMDEDEDEDA